MRHLNACLTLTRPTALSRGSSKPDPCITDESARILNRFDEDWRLWASTDQTKRFWKIGDIDEDLALGSVAGYRGEGWFAGRSVWWVTVCVWVGIVGGRSVGVEGLCWPGGFFQNHVGRQLEL